MACFWATSFMLIRDATYLRTRAHLIAPDQTRHALKMLIQGEAARHSGMMPPTGSEMISPHRSEMMSPTIAE